MIKPAPPATVVELEQRANLIAGKTLGELADACDLMIPNNLRRDKGWVGQLLELQLGTNAANKAEPDFMHLGIELKTIPLDLQGKPQESTFVSTIPLMRISHLTWETSIVKKKLNHVLWVPVEASANIPLAKRRVGTPILWQATPEQSHYLQQDWEELTDLISLGQIEQITARMGHYLQIRPKGANNKALVKAIGPEGAPMMTLPRGFYLRPCFTQEILKSA